jgi:hypothetical protein
LKNGEKTIDNNFSLLPSHTTTLSTEHANPYLDLILKEIMYFMERNEKSYYRHCEHLMKMFGSMIKRTRNNECVKKELHRIWLFIRCLIDLIVNKPEIIGYTIGEKCDRKVMENKACTGIFDIWRDVLHHLVQCSLQPYVELFDPQSTQVTFITESCYDLSKNSIYDLENIITKFILDNGKYTLNNSYTSHIYGIEKFLEIYTYPLTYTLTDMVIGYWIHKLPKLINGKTRTLKVTPEISKFTEEVLRFHKDFYEKINKEFENFDYNMINEKNNIIPFIYYHLSTIIIHSLIFMISRIYDTLFKWKDRFTNWDEFVKFFIRPLYEIYDNFCEKLIIDNDDNKLNLYKCFSNCTNLGLRESIRYWGQATFDAVYREFDYIYMYVSILEEKDEEWVSIKNKILQNEHILEKWIDYFKKFRYQLY